jgi:hypothetical protein
MRDKKALIFATVVLTLISTTKGNNQLEPKANEKFEVIQADKYFVPPADETIAILLYLYGGRDCNICPEDCNACPLIAIIGDKIDTEKIIGKELEPFKLIKGRDWLEKIMNGYSIALKEAEEKDFWSPNDAKIIFITRNKGYIRNLSFKEEAGTVYDEYMESKLLGDYFKELGFIPIMPQQADEYFIPSKDDTVAILLYRYQGSLRGPSPPVALFGDKKQAEKLLYGDKELVEKMLNFGRQMMEEESEGFVPVSNLEPKRVFEGREWLEKIMDAYEIALKKAEEQERKEIRGYRSTIHDGSIVFVTRNEAYTREIKVGESDIRDDDMDSEQLKAYFDELGLTGELLEGKTPEKFEFVLAGDYFVPLANETKAILLHKWSSEKRDINTPLALLGEKKLTEKIIGRSLEPEKLFEDHNMLIKITDTYRNALKESEENHFERDSSDSFARIIFITTTKGYIRFIGIDEDTVYDIYMESEPLKKYFDEIGLTDELLSSSGFRLVGASNYRLPSTDKVVAILLYPQYPGYYGYNYPPAAIFGNKQLAEKLLNENKEIEERLKGKPLEPKKLFEGREWLVKIMDAYGTALKESKGKGFICEKSKKGRIFFVTTKQGYTKLIGVDANTVYDRYMESELLKKYFDELGITDEMGRSKFNISFMGYDDVLHADEITAILLYPPYNYNIYTPLVLIGDKKITEKIMGVSLEPEKIIEGRDLLVKIIDAYETALKEAKEGAYIESEPLKKYFNELGLTDGLLVAEPNKVSQN